MSLLFFFLMIRPTPTSTLFPYTTLFRSHAALQARHDVVVLGVAPLRGIGTERQRQQHLRLLGSPDRKSTRLNSSHSQISYAVFCLKKKKIARLRHAPPMRTPDS